MICITKESNFFSKNKEKLCIPSKKNDYKTIKEKSFERIDTLQILRKNDTSSIMMERNHFPLTLQAS